MTYKQQCSTLSTVKEMQLLQFYAHYKQPLVCGLFSVVRCVVQTAVYSSISSSDCACVLKQDLQLLPQVSNLVVDVRTVLTNMRMRMGVGMTDAVRRNTPV